MTEQKSFKRLVRARMEKTGESYTAARARLLRAEDPSGGRGVSRDLGETIRRRTGRGWEEWFELLDEWGAPDRTHREIARWLAEQQGSSRWRGTSRRSSAATSGPAGCAPSARRRTDSWSPPRGRWRCRSSGCMRRSSTSRARARGSPTAGCASARRLDRSRRGSTGATEHAGQRHLPREGRGEEHRWRSSTARLADPSEAERMKAYWRERLSRSKRTGTMTVASLRTQSGERHERPDTHSSPAL